MRGGAQRQIPVDHRGIAGRRDGDMRDAALGVWRDLAVVLSAGPRRHPDDEPARRGLP